MITPGSSIGITAGTTTVQLAGLLTDIEDLFVVTNSVAVAELSARKTKEQRHPSGDGRHAYAVDGPWSVRSRTQHCAIFTSTSCSSVCTAWREGTGYTSPNLLEAQTLKVFIEASAESVIVLADHTKWGTVGLSSIGPLSIADTIVTDQQVSLELPSECARGCQVSGVLIIAGNGPS